MRRRSLAYLLIVIPLISGARMPALAQVEGTAEIRQPSEGQEIGESVTVLGTAAHPSFTGYELSYATDPNPTDTWFPITGRVDVQVDDSRLAIWDTSQLDPGRYQLQLVVYRHDEEPLLATVFDLSVTGRGGATQDQATPPSEGKGIEPQPSATGGSNVAAGLVEPPAAAVTADQLLVRVLGVGAGLATSLLAMFGLYELMRPRLREYAGRLRMRQVHRRLSRRRRRRHE
jgi:hypothetical protein